MTTKTHLMLATLALAAAGAAHAEGTTGPAANRDPAMPAVVTDETPAAIAPAAGSNSFTQKQAMSRLQEQGYTKISTLKTDKDGVWRGTAMMGGTKKHVAVDYQGNVTAK